MRIRYFIVCRGAGFKMSSQKALGRVYWIGLPMGRVKGSKRQGGSPRCLECGIAYEVDMSRNGLFVHECSTQGDEIDEKEADFDEDILREK